ncbi:hypothetical protein Hanom_Chr06g00492051 [Helianthus anomalus]
MHRREMGFAGVTSSSENNGSRTDTGLGFSGLVLKSSVLLASECSLAF